MAKEIRRVGNLRIEVDANVTPEAWEKIRRRAESQSRYKEMGRVQAPAAIAGQSLMGGAVTGTGALGPDLLGAGLGMAGKATGLSERFPEFFAGMSAPSATLRRGLSDIGLSTSGDPQEIPREYRPLAAGGETVGMAVPFAAAPYAALGAGVKPTTAAGTAILGPAMRRPLSTAAGELAAATGAGVGGAVAEATAPGRPGVRFGAEIAGGIASPVVAFSKATGALANRAKGAVTGVRDMFDPETAAARWIQGQTKALGEDPASIARSLREPSPTAAPMSSGTKSQSVTLLSLEQKLARDLREFDVRLANRLTDSIKEINASFRALRAAGTPEALRELAELRKQHFNNLMDAHTELAETKAMRAAESVVPDLSVSESGKQARTALESAYRAARGQEKTLWNSVDRNIPVDEAPAVSSALNRKDPDSALGGLLQGEGVGLSKPILRTLTKARKGKATSGDLITTRGRILAEIRQEAGAQAPNRDRIRRLGILSDAIMDDLAALGEDAASARDFSRTLNERFTKGYVGDVLSMTPRGGAKIAPELTLQTGLGEGSGPRRALRAGEMETAATPIEGMEQNMARLNSLRQAESQMVHNLASEAIDPSTGLINPKKLERFRARNRELLEKFPELDSVLSDASKASAVYGRRISRIEGIKKRMKNESAFSRVLGVEDTDQVFDRTLSGNFPVRDTERIFQMAAKNPRAREGAKTAFLDYLFRQSTDQLSSLPDSPSMVNGTKLTENLMAQDGRVLAAARRHGILSENEVDRLLVLAQEARKAENAMLNWRELQGTDPDTMLNLLARLVGANVGGHSVIAKTSGASLVMAGAVSRAAQRLVHQTPLGKMKEVLRAASEDPDLMAMLLEKPVSPGKTERTFTRIFNKLERKGLYQSGLQRAGERIMTAPFRAPVGFKGAAATRYLQSEEEE